jgi:hypothetical protein
MLNLAVRVFQDSHQRKKHGPKKCPWSVGWSENGRKRSKVIGTRADADRFAALKKSELVDGALGIETRKRWDDFVAEYLREEVEGSGKRPATVTLVRRVLKTFTRTVDPAWVYLIDAKTLDRFRRERLKARGRADQPRHRTQGTAPHPRGPRGGQAVEVSKTLAGHAAGSRRRSGKGPRHRAALFGHARGGRCGQAARSPDSPAARRRET